MSNHLEHAYVGVLAHELGHMLGLVSLKYLGGKSGDHNATDNPGFIMNDGNTTPMIWRMDLAGIRGFNPFNTSYLIWLLP